MASRSLKPCSYPGCASLVKSGKCEQHKQQVQQQYDKQRGTAAQRGYGRNWAKIRKLFLLRFPLCYDCQENNHIVPANEVHHLKALRDGGTNNFDKLMALCHSCHSKRTIKENGGFVGKG